MTRVESALDLSTEPPRSRARIWLAIGFLIVYTGIVLTITMWPTPVDQGYESAVQRLLAVLHRNGVPSWFGYNKLEFTANVLMFIPLGFLVGLALPHRLRWLAFLLVPAFSGAIELTQLVLLSHRYATWEDVLSNSIGGIIGAAAALGLRWVVNQRDDTVVARALWEHGVR